ncbi:sigma 54-interacting transcriptional regulator [Candidatus Uabimicrobium sp. HlEnr_7]|uniref:sigma 54-interacting transcriptional regulator n=1 Tax=Candidatus Uabimicrobium helgolandensis TaxID=3095367 RepID=UPI00355601F6
MEDLPSVTDILVKLKSIVSNSSQEDSYLHMLKLIAIKFDCAQITLCITKQQNKTIYSKLFVNWDAEKQSSTIIDNFISIAEIKQSNFSKYASSLDKQPKQKLVVSKDKYEASFRSTLYYFVFKMPKKMSIMEQYLLSQFIEFFSVVLPTFFQITQLTKNIISYENENDLLKETMSHQNDARSELKYSYSEITGESKPFLELLQYLDKVIEHSDKNDLLYLHGESGTGKSMLAKAIHRYSSRSSKRFVEINCGAIVENLCEAEFLGVAANSGVANVNQDGKPGLFELADGGTLFLDEISELSLTMQASLLTVIEGKPFRRVCGSKDIKVDVRIISASIHDIKTMPDFLPELAQRLDGIRLEIPPLRERKQDIDKLIDYFCKQLSPSRQKNITPEMRKAFVSYDWPGNIRELANYIRRCSIDGKIPQHLVKTNTSTYRYYNQMSTYEELLHIEKTAIIKSRIYSMLKENPRCNLDDMAESFGLKRDALRRRLQEVGYTWEKIKKECLDR